MNINNEFFDYRLDHSQIKTEIVVKYFVAWAKIISKHFPSFAYVDLYSGPGIYKKNKVKSTPIIITENVINNKHIDSKKFRSFFNDKDTENILCLQRNLEVIDNFKTLCFPIINCGEVTEILAKRVSTELNCPKLCFVDPFGYKGLSLDLIKILMESKGSECIVFFNYNRINAAITNSTVDKLINEIFGIKRADLLRNAVKKLYPYDRETFIIDEFKNAIKNLFEPTLCYIRDFCFKDDKKDKTSHYIIHVAKHKKGHQIMTDIMAPYSDMIDQGVSSFRYTHPEQNSPVLFSNFPLNDLKNKLVKHFEKRTLSVSEIIDEHMYMEDSNYRSTNYKEALKLLEKDGTIISNPPVGKRPVNTMGNNVEITFL